MPSGLPFDYSDLQGGLNSKSAPHLLEDSQARDLLNVQSSSTGAVVKRNGFQSFAAPASGFQSLYAVEETAAPWLIGTTATTIQKVSAAGAVTAITPASPPTSGRWEWVQAQASGAQGPVWGVNGVDANQQWDGTAGTTSPWTANTGGTQTPYRATVPQGRYLAFHQNHVIIAGVDAAPNTVYWSEINATDGVRPDRFPTANAVQLDPNDGDRITGVGKAGPYLVVFKKRKTFVITNIETGANRRVSSEVGCVAHRSIAETGVGTLFLTEDRGVYLTDGAKVQLVSDAIAPTLDRASSIYKSNAAAVAWGTHYYLAYSDAGPANNKILDYDLTTRSWWLHSVGATIGTVGVAPSQWAVWHPSSGSGLYAAYSNTARIDQAFVPNVYQDVGTGFYWVWKGPWQSPSFYRRRRYPTTYYRKRFQQLRVDGGGTVDYSQAFGFTVGEVLFKPNIFSQNPTTFGGTGVFGGAGGTFGGPPTVSQAILYNLGISRAISMVFSATSSTADYVNSYTLWCHDRTVGAV